MSVSFEQTRTAVLTWAARHHAAELRAAANLYLGDQRRTEETAYAAAAFALLAPAVDAPALFERYAAANPSLPRAQRQALATWKTARFGLYEVREVEIDRGFHLRDSLTEHDLFVQERAATRQIGAGDWLYAFVVEVGGHFELEGTLGRLLPATRIDAVQAALATLSTAGVAPGEADTALTRQLARPVLAAIHLASRPPRLQNTEGHDVCLVTTTLEEPWSEIERVVGVWPTAEIEELHINVLAETASSDLGGPAIRGTFACVDGGNTLFTNSKERHAELLARWEASAGTPARIRSTREATVPSNPNGPVMTVDQGAIELESDEVPATAFATRHAKTWADTPIPALDGLTPRAALAAGRRAEVRALLPEGVDDLDGGI